MNKEIVKQESNMPQVAANHHAEQILASDMLIPRILLMQALSDYVSDGDCKAGDIVKSVGREVIGNKEMPFDFIPITFKNMWMLKEMTSSRGEFRGMEPRNASNENLPWEFEQDGVMWKRTKVLEVYALLPQDVQNDLEEKERVAKKGGIPDLSKALLPAVITFQSTGFKEGKNIYDHFTRCRHYNVAPYAYQLSLGATFQENDKGKYYVWKFDGAAKPTKPEYAEVAAQWHSTLTSSGASFEVDDSSFEEKSKGEPTEY